MEGPITESPDLGRRFRDGDPEAARELYRTYGRVVFAIAFRALGDRGLAEEVVQQAFLQAWRRADTLDTERPVGPWLCTITKRAAIDAYRRESRRRHDDLDDLAEGDASMVTLPMGIERITEAWEVRAAVDGLAPEEREVVRLQHFDGLSHPEVAARLGIPVGTVKSRSFRAHKHLATALRHLREVTA